jgi:hypothetical protein
LLRSRDPFQRNHEQAQRSAKEQLKLIMLNLPFLRRVDKDGRLEKAAREFADRMGAGEQLSENVLSFIDNIYEKMMKGAGFASVGVHSDRKARSLRY